MTAVRFREWLAPSSEPMRRHWILRLAVIDGLIGFLAGTFFRVWQVALEPGQVLAGLVAYPAWNPEYRYQAGTWTLLNQLSGLGLRAGLSEIAVATMLGALAGAISFAGLALIVFALCRRPAIAALAPLLLICARGGSAIPGVTYNVALIFSGGTYGMFGIAMVVLVLGLLACDELGWAGFAAAVMVSVHPSFSVWLGATLAVVALVRSRWVFAALRKSWPLWLAGLAISTLSLVAHRSAVPGISLSPPRAESSFLHGSPANAAHVETAPSDATYLATFIRLWDAHRRRFDLWSPPMAEVYVGAAWGILLLGLCRRERMEGGTALGVVLIAAAAIGLAFSVCYWMPPENVPRILLALMPSRVLNINLALGLAVAIGGLANRRWGSDWLLFAALFALMANAALAAGARFSAGFRAIGLGAPMRQWVIAGIGAAILAAIAVRRSRMPEAANVERNLPEGGRRTTLAVVACAAVVVVAAAFVPWPAMRDRTNDPFWKAVASRPGMLVTSPGVTLVQARTRRPVLLNPYSLDYLPFTPGVGATMEAILRDVYGIELLDPPEHLRRARRGGLVPQDGRKLWESRTRAEWSRLGRRFEVTGVLCDASWRIDLPPVARDQGWALYTIGDAAALTR